MAKTADVQQAIWADPWFIELPPDAKLLYLWAITTSHGNLAGLFVVGVPVICFETGLTPARFERALEVCRGKLAYNPDTGVMWVVGRAKHVRAKTPQIATSIARTVADCPDPALKAAFLTKYLKNRWLSDHLSDLASEAEISEVHMNLSEVPYMSMSMSMSNRSSRKEEKKEKEESDDYPDSLGPELRGVAERVWPVLQRVAERRGAKPVRKEALGRAIESYPNRDYVKVASELEHWCLYGNGAKRPCKDVVARYRNFLDRAEEIARPAEGRVTVQGVPDSHPYAKYDKVAISEGER